MGFYSLFAFTLLVAAVANAKNIDQCAKESCKKAKESGPDQLMEVLMEMNYDSDQCSFTDAEVTGVDTVQGCEAPKNNNEVVLMCTEDEDTAVLACYRKIFQPSNDCKTQATDYVAFYEDSISQCEQLPGSDATDAPEGAGTDAPEGAATDAAVSDPSVVTTEAPSRKRRSLHGFGLSTSV